MSFREIIEHSSLSTLSRELIGIDIPATGQTTCPCCHSVSASVMDDKRIKCFKPGCQLNKQSDIGNLLVILGRAASLKEAYGILRKTTHLTNTNTKPDWSSRTQVLSRVFHHYEAACLENLETIDTWLRGRKLIKIADHICGKKTNPFYKNQRIGYAPSPHYLQDCGLDKDILAKHHLLKRSGDKDEFYDNHIIFPLHTATSGIIHLQGRHLDPKSQVRWLSTGTPETLDIPSCTNFFFNGFQLNNKPKPESLFITEGITDTLSLLELGVKAIGSLGLTPPLKNNITQFDGIKYIILVFDNDRHPINSQLNGLSGLYKSWTQILPSLIYFLNIYPNAQVFCVTAPEQSGICDLNDWLQTGLTRKTFEEYCLLTALRIQEFYISHYGGEIKYHRQLLELLKVQHPDSKAVKLLKSYVETLGLDPVDYALQILPPHQAFVKNSQLSPTDYSGSLQKL